jgi:shikimate kinase
MAPKAVLVGLPGSGKSTIGRRLAKALDVTLVDTDAAIEARTGRSIGELFATDGEPAFRRIEEEVVRAALAEHDGVLSLGGGAITSKGVRDALVGHTVIYLEITAAEGVRRTGNTVRPLLAGPDRAEKYRALMADRVPLYRSVATMRVNTNRRNPGAVVRHIVSRLENPQENTEDTGNTKPDPPRRRRRRPSCRRRPGRVLSSPASEQSAAQPPTPATQAALSSRNAERRQEGRGLATGEATGKQDRG